MADFTDEEISNLKEEIMERLNTEEDLLQFQNLVTGKDVTIFLGNTRSGKSTLINYLIGNSLRSVKRKKLRRRYKIELCDDDVGPGIGDGSLSVTNFPTAHTTPRGSILIDSPGFEDNRGIPQDVFNALCVNRIQFANSIKFVLVCYIHDLVNDNVQSFTNLLSQMTHLITNIENIQNSVCIIFTKDYDNYTPEELRTIMTENILNQNRFDVDRRLLRNLAANNERIGIFKMPTSEGDIILNELEVSIHSAIDACEQVPVGELNIRFSLSDRSNLFLKEIYPEFIDTQYFESEIRTTVNEYINYFDIDLYVFGSYPEELNQVRNVLDVIKNNLTLEEVNISSLADLRRSLETLLEARGLGLSNEFERSFRFILELDNVSILEENYREIIIQNYINSRDALLRDVNRLITNINDEIESRRQNNVLQVYNAGLFVGGVGSAVGGTWAAVSEIASSAELIPDVAAFTAAEVGVSSVAALTACGVGAVAVSASLGAAYVWANREIFRRRQVRAEQNRETSSNFL